MDINIYAFFLIKVTKILKKGKTNEKNLIVLTVLEF